MEVVIMTKLVYNQELNGIEIYFDGKPDQAILDNLKNTGFRWSNFKKCWYAKQSEKTIKEAEKYINTDKKEEQPEAVTVRKTERKQENKSLWDRIQHINKLAEVENPNRKEIKGYKYVGNNYTGLSTKETAQEIRKILKGTFPEVKFSVTSDYNSIDITIKSSPYNNSKLEYSPELRPFEYREFEAEHNKELTAIQEAITSLLSSYNYDDSDSQSDYFCVHFYKHINIDSHYVQTEQNEIVKNDITDFRNKLQQEEQTEEERKEKEYHERVKQQEEDHKQYLIRQEEEKKEIEIINNSISVKEIEAEQQYYIIGSQFAHLNKNCRLEQYKEEVTAGEFYLQDLKVTREVHFNNEQALQYFSNMLLIDFDFIKGTGNSVTDDIRIQSMIDYDNMSEEERKTVDWYSEGIAVYYNNTLQFVIDAQGFGYARYVGLVSNDTKISNNRVTEQAITVEQQTEYKVKAEAIEDYSTSLITALDMVKTWNNEEWTEYKELMKEQLTQQNIRLSKEIIQQINRDFAELKTAMYKLLKEVDGIQDQFKNADLKEGQKYTLFRISDFGSMTISRITLDKVEYTKYAQYDNAVKLTFTPERKRTKYYSHFYSELLVYNGWLELPTEVLYTVEKTGTYTITKTKYLSCDRQQYDEVINYFAEQNIQPIINTYKPIF
jgi:hypothetical protein